MRCASCGHESSAHAKFCEECGNRLAQVCPQCGSESSPTAKFCSACGLPLSDPVVCVSTEFDGWACSVNDGLGARERGGVHRRS
ncbi:double zinc ribbon domain-containing protein [Cupriavidus necator]